MMHIKHWLRAWPSVAMALSMAALAGVSLVGQASSSKPAAPKKAPFPVALHAGAAAEDYLGEKTCGGCHPAYLESFEASPHAQYVRDSKLPVDHRGCESCHGPGKNHLENQEEGELQKHIFAPSKASAADVNAMCLRCHSRTMSESHWKKTAHARGDMSCRSCHFIHKDAKQSDPAARATRDAQSIRKPTAVAVKETQHLLKDHEADLCGSCHKADIAQFRQPYHHPVPEGRMTCSDCHEPHPTRTSLRKGSMRVGLKNPTQVCATCHREVAGPFVYQHDPVTGASGDGCVECHKPHGATNPKMLGAFSRGLCNQCHTDKNATHYPGQTCWASGCHAALHGSNRDPNLLVR